MAFWRKLMGGVLAQALSSRVFPGDLLRTVAGEAGAMRWAHLNYPLERLPDIKIETIQ